MPDAKRLSAESLEEWRANPVTEWLLSVLSKGASSNKHALLSEAWDTGEIDPVRHGRVQAQNEIVEDLKEATADEWNEWAERFEQ